MMEKHSDYTLCKLRPYTKRGTSSKRNVILGQCTVTKKKHKMCSCVMLIWVQVRTHDYHPSTYTRLSIVRCDDSKLLCNI